jgi:hypothetical protein
MYANKPMLSRVIGYVIPICLIVGANAADWKPVDVKELAETSPKVEKDADAEIIFSETRILDQAVSGHPQWYAINYIRVKIYNYRGRDRFSTIHIPLPPKTSVIDIAGRTIHPDGKIIELSKNAISETMSKEGGTALKEKSFPMPAVEPGSIIEYRWRASHTELYAHYVRLELQRDMPARLVRYFIKPYSAPNFPYVMAVQNFNAPEAPMVLQPDGYYLKSIENVPAFKANLEPRMPPSNELRIWSLIYYKPLERRDADHFWVDYGKKMYASFKPRMKVGKEIHQKAAELTQKAATPLEKLAILSEFCRKNIKNLTTEAVSAEEREDADKNKTPEDTLNQGMGPPDDIRYLFAALAAATGLDARIALLPSRSNVFFNRSFADPFFLTGKAVAVRIDGGWNFFDPGDPFIPNGMLAWFYEGTSALITDPKEPVFELTPITSAERSKIWSVGNFALSEDGTLEGDIVVAFSGQEGVTQKKMRQRQSEAQQQRAFEDTIHKAISTIEISNIVIENASDIEKAITYKAHVRVPGYAQRTGKRLLFPPSVFHQGEASRFSNRDRKYPIYFAYPWTEDDRVTISIPPGFEFATPQVPPQISFGDIGSYEVHASIENRNKLIYTRKFTYGDKGLVLPKESYTALKLRFDAVVAADAHTLELKQTPLQTASPAR